MDRLTNSVGIVSPDIFRTDTPFKVCSGREIPFLEIVYETYGELNASRSNAILVCHALSGDHHAAGFHSESDRKPGWWDEYIGPGKPIDTNRFFVVSPNNIGGCSGSTGPRSKRPDTGELWGPDFPVVRVRDWVESQKLLADHLGIAKWAAVIGGSLGGMQALRWAIDYPDKLRHCVAIASAMKLTAQNIAFNETSRKAIVSDPNFHSGHYEQQGTIPKNGLALARMIGHITYLSGDVMGEKFGRELRSGSFELGKDHELEFQVASYLHHQGDAFSENFDANTYLLMTRALDFFDLARDFDNDPVAAFRQTLCRYFIVSFTSDWRFSPARSREIVESLISAEKQVTYVEIETPLGHDAFLLPVQRYRSAFSAYMKNVAEEVS